MGLLLTVVIWLALGCAGGSLLYYWAAYHQRTRPVFVRGLRLPRSLVRADWKGQRRGHLIVKEPRDAHGSFWEPGVVLLAGVKYLHEMTAEAISRLTLEAREYARASEAWAVDPGFIPYITDFSQIVLVGHGQLSTPICLDFREDPREPSVIWWNGLYWGRAAPTCASFLALLKPYDPQRQPDWHPAAVPEGQAIGCVSVALAAVAPYDIWDLDYDVLIDVVYSRSLEPTIVFLPCRRYLRHQCEPAPEWGIWVTIPGGEVTDPTLPAETNAIVSTRGSVEAAEPGSPKAMLGQAVLAACKHWAALGNGPGFQGFVRVASLEHGARDTQRRYLVHCGSVSRAIDSHVNFWVSEDFTAVRGSW